MKTPAAVAKIEDPKRRLQEAARLVRDADKELEVARAERDMAVVVAHLDQGVPPVVLYRDVLDVSRGLFNRIIQRAPADEDRKRIVSEYPDLFADASATAAAAVKRVRKYETVAEQARVIRDATSTALMNGEDEHGNKVPLTSNAEVARLTGLTTARIAQVRTGV